MASDKPYFENEVGVISEHPDGYVVFTYRSGKRTAEQLQAVILRIANLLEIRGWHRVLSDQRLMEPFTPEETERASALWQQRTHQWGHGLCLATVLAKDVFARLSANVMRQELRSASLSYRVFDNLEEAGSWLREQKTVPPLQ